MAQPNTPQKVKVLRPFFYAGNVLALDSTHTLPRAFAGEMQTANKVQFIYEDEPQAAPRYNKPERKE